MQGREAAEPTDAIVRAGRCLQTHSGAKQTDPPLGKLR
ncbi:GTP cyclohydrolase III [Streptomyces nodosus]|nr:GTP cyclohydrolase III [Streptomyces nodosus]